MARLTRNELDRRLREADRARQALRRTTRELEELGDALLEHRQDRRGKRSELRPEATREPAS